MVTRFKENPIIRPSMLKPSMDGMKIRCTINPWRIPF